jgi:hypothetical protein
MKSIDHLLRVFEIGGGFPARSYVGVTGLLDDVIQPAISPLRVEDPFDIPFLGLVDNRGLRFRWWLPGYGRCISAAQRDVKHIIDAHRLNDAHL